MNLILDELKRTLKYHKRQLEDNLNQIKIKEESINMLRDANEKHHEVIKEIEDFIKNNESVNDETSPLF